MESTKLRLSGWCLALAIMPALACGGGGSGGGGSDGGSGDAKLKNVSYQCNGLISDNAGPPLPLPGGETSTLPPLDVCVLSTTTPAAAATKCIDKCTSMLQLYADAINAATPGLMVDMSNLMCNVTSANIQFSDCPDTELLSASQSPLSGGPSQYVATVGGNQNLAVTTDTGIPGIGTVTVSSDSALSGQFAYTILPLNRGCPPAGCKLLVTAFDLNAANFSIGLTVLGITFFQHDVTGMEIQNAGWITGAWFPDNHFVIPAGVGHLAVTANDNGAHSSMDRFNDAAITGTIDPVSGVVTFDPFVQAEGNGTITISGLGGPNVSAPPTAVISSPLASVECNAPNGAEVTLNGAASTAPNGDIHFHSWRVNGGPVIAGAVVPATLNLGANTVFLTVANSTLGLGTASQTVTVVDTTPPVIGIRPSQSFETCSTGSTAITLTPPTASDACNPIPAVSGSVVSSTPPIPVVNGHVSLPPGVHIVKWTASDGVNSAVSLQTVTVQPGVMAKGQFLLGDRSRVKTVSGGPAGVGNAGTVLTRIGYNTNLGDVVSVAPVTLLDRITITGSVISAGHVTPGNSNNITGSTISFGMVSLPAVPDLTGVVFPSPSGGNKTFNSGPITPLAPGSYATVIVNSGARVSLSAGTYYFQQLMINAASSTLIIPSTGIVRIYVASQLAYRGQVVTSGGQLAQIVLGYNGTANAILEAPFYGTLLAPRGLISIGTSSAQTFRGRFYGQTLDVRPDINLVCDVAVTAQ